MTTTDLKLYTLNIMSLFISMTAVEPALKIILLVASIGYTIQRWWIMNKTKETKE
jgi:hypothetical protein